MEILSADCKDCDPGTRVHRLVRYDVETHLVYYCPYTELFSDQDFQQLKPDENLQLKMKLYWIMNR